jgi:hypothetical protein
VRLQRKISLTGVLRREEFAIFNPDRIDHIEIIKGPKELIGLGREFWSGDRATLDAAVRSKQAEFADERASAGAAAETTYTAFVKAAAEAAQAADVATLLDSENRLLSDRTQQLKSICKGKPFLIGSVGPGGGILVHLQSTSTGCPVGPYDRYCGLYTAQMETAADVYGDDVTPHPIFLNVADRNILLRQITYKNSSSNDMSVSLGWELTSADWCSDTNEHYLLLDSQQSACVGLPLGELRMK